jgi:hypothetical protein
MAMRGSVWMYPIVEVLHIVGFVILVGAVFMFDLRVLGFSRFLPVHTLGRHVLRWSASGLLLVVPAGLMMFSAHPQDFASNGVFLTKLCLIATAGINAALFHVGVYRSVGDWDKDVAAPPLAKAQALLSMALWIAVITCGRFLAYT